MTANESMLEKVAKLLSHAESTTHEEEKDAFLKKAQALMQEYQIDRAQLAARGTQRDEQVVNIEMAIPRATPGRNGRRILLDACAKYNRCQSYGYSSSDSVHIIGHETDVAYVLKLYQYLSKQMDTELMFASAWSEESPRTFTANFTVAFAGRVNMRLKAMQLEIAPEESSVALVLVGKEKRVEAFVEKHVGPLRTSSISMRDSQSARIAGDAAGRRADLNPVKGIE